MVAEMTSYEIIDALVDDGYVLSYSEDTKDVVEAIKSSARRGALLWTREHVVSTIPRYNRVLRRCLTHRHVDRARAHAEGRLKADR